MKRHVTALDWFTNIIENLNEDKASLGLSNKVKKKFNDVDAIENISDYVDLGFPSGNLWCSHNVGAEDENEYGNYFTFDEANKQYNLPSLEDYKEFIENTSCKLGKNGVVFTSRINGNSIFFPFSGHYDNDGFEFGKGRWAYYWSSTEYEFGSKGYAFNIFFECARSVGFIQNYVKTAIRTIINKKVNENLGLGLNKKVKSKFGKVNPIKNIDTEYIDLGLPSGILWKACNVGAKEPYEFGSQISFDDMFSNIRDEEIPSLDDYEELIRYTKSSWDQENHGIELISNTNGNTIFFPAGGFGSFATSGFKFTVDENEAGYYWACTEDSSAKGKCFCFDQKDIEVSQMIKESTLCIRTIIR